MPRVAGQIDVTKNEAILDAAMEVMAERGVAAVSMDEIARRAGVSKQTIYNHYGSKAELVRTMAERRVHDITAPLGAPDAAENPEAALAGFAKVLIAAAITNQPGLYRAVILNAPEMPDVALAMWEAGPKASRAALAVFLAQETKAGRMFCPNAAEAAEFFAGMVIGSYQTAWLLGVEVDLSEPKVDHIAREASMRFMRAYAV